MHISDWSSDVCSSDLKEKPAEHTLPQRNREPAAHQGISVGRRAGRMGSIIRPILGARIHAHRISYVLAPITPRYMLSITAETTRSEERRVGKECVSKFRSRWSPDH